MDGGDVGAGEGAIVHDLFDAGTGGSDLRGKIGQPARAIANHGSEAGKPAIGDQTPFDHAAQNVWVDVPSAQKKNHTLASQFRQVPGQTGGEGSSGRAFDDPFF
jgi:hypothetical protein